MSGLLGMLVDTEDPQPVGPAFSDHIAGLYAAYGCLGALVERDRTGHGQHVGTSLLEATMAFLAEPIATLLATGTVPAPVTRPAASQAFAFRCRDGRVIAIHLSSPQKFWESLLAATGRPELALDERYNSRASRVANYAALREALAPTFLSEDYHHWAVVLDELDVPFTPVYSLDEAVADPQVAHLNMLQSLEHPSLGAVDLVRPGLRTTSAVPCRPSPPPALGQHTVEVLTQLGIDDEERDSLQEDGTILIGSGER
jgi:formyl-CoA transferase